MSGTTVFAFGTFVFLLLLGGLIFTVIEMQRIGREAEAKRPSSRPSVRTLPPQRDSFPMAQRESQHVGRKQ
jgi:hypothetical protein